MKKITPVFLTLFSLALLLGPAAAPAAEYDGFQAITAASLRPFARDIGGLLGSGSNQTARPLGFSGFDIGARAVAQFNPSHGNTALKKNNTFGLGFVQAEMGMPYRLDGFVRGGAYEGMAVAGGGLRYGLWNVSDEKYRINAMLVAMGNMAAHRYFYAVHFNTSLVCSLNVPVVSPYLGAGFDFTRLEAQTVSDPALSGKRVSVSEPRFTAGLRVKMNLGYIAGGITYTHDRPLVNASAGFRF
ncbi:MAG TPA: hypothetical protein DCS63_02945 [Elusimicrobia bacterium]|nr:hypothetical protein [Elusimicrobiota bacterium]